LTEAAVDTRQKILVVDDDPDLLEMYRVFLVAKLPSQPLIHTANSGPLGLAMLEAESFDLLICNLRMPMMDGLQVLEIVCRKYPQLRTMMLTGTVDEELSSRAYAIGVDLFCNKPCTEEETKVWLEQVESLLERKPPGSLEQADPGAKPILPSMAADTPALAERNQPPKTRPPRIVVLDDEPLACDALRLMLHLESPNAEILTFTDTEQALQALMRNDPDLFTTDMCHPGLTCEQMFRFLAARRVKYAIFVISAWAESDRAKEMVRQYVDQGLNVTLLEKPYTLEQLRSLLSKHLGPGHAPKLRMDTP
jgi:CheY-like chemotaxis protein